MHCLFQWELPLTHLRALFDHRKLPASLLLDNSGP